MLRAVSPFHPTFSHSAGTIGRVGAASQRLRANISITDSDLARRCSTRSQPRPRVPPRNQVLTRSSCGRGHERAMVGMQDRQRLRFPAAGVLDGFTVTGFGGAGGTTLCRVPRPPRPAAGELRGKRWGKPGTRMSGSRPISRVLSRAIIHLGRTSPYASSDLPGSLCEPQVRGRCPARFPIWSCSRWGLPCHRVLPPARCALTAPFHPYLPILRPT